MSRPPGSHLAPDYVAHFVLYGVFALTIAWGVTRGAAKELNLLRGGVTWAVCMGFALTDEFHQAFVPGRDSSAHDLFSDAAGAAVFIALAFILLRQLFPATAPPSAD